MLRYTPDKYARGLVKLKPSDFHPTPSPEEFKILEERHMQYCRDFMDQMPKDWGKTDEPFVPWEDRWFEQIGVLKRLCALEAASGSRKRPGKKSDATPKKAANKEPKRAKNGRNEAKTVIAPSDIQGAETSVTDVINGETEIKPADV